MSTALFVQAGKMAIVPDLAPQFTVPKTKAMVELLEKLGVPPKEEQTGKGHVMILTAKFDENTNRAANNIPYVNVKPMNGINVRDLLKAKRIIVTQDAKQVIEERYGNGGTAWTSLRSRARVPTMKVFDWETRGNAPPVLERLVPGRAALRR